MDRPDPSLLARFGLTPATWDLVQGQLAVWRHHKQRAVPSLSDELAHLAAADAATRRADGPTPPSPATRPPDTASLDRLRAHLRRRAHMVMHRVGHELGIAAPHGSPALAREDLLAAGNLPHTTPFLLEFRRLFPGADIGVYLANHSMGLPSAAAQLSAADHVGLIADIGIGGWDEGDYPGLMERYQAAVDRLFGGPGDASRVAWCPNVSEGLGAVLGALAPTVSEDGTRRDELVFSSGHFTTGHYVHHQWAQNLDGRCVEVAIDPLAKRADGTAAVLAAIGEKTRVISLSHALFQSGYLHDLEAIAAGIAQRAPRAILVLDVYQTAGTVPIDARGLAVPAILIGASHKQLRASAGAGFIWVPEELVSELRPRRAGWWGHRAPFEFVRGPIQRDEASVDKLRTGTPGLFAMQALVTELAVLSTLGGGDLAAAVRAVRAHTLRQTADVIEVLSAAGLEIRTPTASDSRAAFVCVRSPRARATAQVLLAEGVQLDFRPDPAGTTGLVTGPDGATESGILRFSSSSTTLDYELAYCCLRIVAEAAQGEAAQGEAERGDGGS